jgi:hypothetical protein
MFVVGNASVANVTRGLSTGHRVGVRCDGVEAVEMFCVIVDKDGHCSCALALQVLLLRIIWPRVQANEIECWNVPIDVTSLSTVSLLAPQAAMGVACYEHRALCVTVSATAGVCVLRDPLVLDATLRWPRIHVSSLCVRTTTRSDHARHCAAGASARQARAVDVGRHRRPRDALDGQCCRTHGSVVEGDGPHDGIGEAECDDDCDNDQRASDHALRRRRVRERRGVARRELRRRRRDRVHRRHCVLCRRTTACVAMRVGMW